LAERIGAEIVGCDALQVYRGFDVATAKPTVEERRQVPHHLVDAIDPRTDYSVADYVGEAESVVADIEARGRVPLIVGGTGMYLRGFLRGIVDAPPRDDALRRRLRSMASRFGSARLHRWLSGLDPVSAGRLAPRDTQRVVRALEISLSGGSSWSRRLAERGTWATGRERYRCLKFGLEMDRARLVERIERRVDRFFEAGLVDEVRDLLRRGVPPTANAFKAIGYREVLAAIRSGDDPESVREAVKRATRQYSKRQRTWFRKEPAVEWVDASADRQGVADELAKRWRRLSETTHR